MSPAERHVRVDLNDLRDLALVVEDPGMAEQMLLLVGLVTKVWELHQLDSKIRCLRCRSPGSRVVWRRRQDCAVREIYDEFRLNISSQDEAASCRRDR
jgi:hypothetical protein